VRGRVRDCPTSLAEPGAFSPCTAILREQERIRERKERYTKVAISRRFDSEPMTCSSGNRLKAVVDLIFDALPDLVVAHVRIFQ
jgi:hypothetical protein